MALPQRYIDKGRYTEAEYLRQEEMRPDRSEYVRGEIHTIPDSSVDHSLVMVGFGMALHASLRGRGYRVLSCQMKVWTPGGSIRYPDVSVLQGPSQYRGENRIIITNPVLLAEVCSDSTSGVDHTEKWREYQMIESLQSYLLVSQDAARIEQYARLENGHWDYHTVEGIGARLTIPPLSITLALADIYDGIDFDSRADEDE